MKKQNQKGALLVEVIAVLGLIALITPILFNQIQRRNEEIVDAQIASEVRAVKDALSAYIQANEDALAVSCGLAETDSETNQLTYVSDRTGTEEPCNGDSWSWDQDEQEVVNNYSTTDISSILGDYNVVLYARNIVSKQRIDGDDQVPVAFRPSIYAIAYKTDPEPNLRRAAKIAAMVGVEGGVAREAGQIDGMQGVWSAEITGVPQYAVAVTTSFDATTNSAILKDATFSNMQAGSVQGDVIVADRLGAMGVLSVADSSCIIDYGNDTVDIKKRSEDSTCTPVFEVDPTTKEVHVAGVIRTRTKVNDSVNATCNTKLDQSECESTAYCVWVSQPTETDPNAKGCVAEYVLDPANISVVKDIKLSSRGGAKLSDILPKWSLKETGECPNNCQPDRVVCPSGSSLELAVVPVNIPANSASTVTVQATPANKISITLSGATSARWYQYCVFND